MKKKVMISILFIFVMFLSVKSVLALEISFNIEVSNSSDVILNARDVNGIVAFNNPGDGLVGVRGEGDNIFGFEDTYNNNEIDKSNISIVCTSNKVCTATVTVPEEHGVRVVVGGDAPFTTMKDGQPYDGSPIANNNVIEIVNRDNNFEPFDGKAYLIWSCKNGGTCYHYFDNISTENPMFIKASDVKDDNTNEVFDVHATIKGFALKNVFEEWQNEYKTYKNTSSIDWAKLDTNLVVGLTDMREYEEKAIKAGACSKDGVDRDTFERCVDAYVASLGEFTMHANLQPVGEPFSNNAYVSYGDRNFKVTIYNDAYRGISIGSLEGLSYYPAVWNDPFLRVEAYDISGTTKSNPIDIDSILLEPVINIKALNEYNSFVIEKMEAVDVPSNAVNITKNDDEFKLKFNSNFYDKVVFKVTGANNETLYLRVNRITLDVQDTVRYKPNDGRDADIIANFYFDRTTNYSDYNINIKFEYKDGTSKKVEMTNAKEIDDGLGNKTYAYEVDLEDPKDGPAGKGLKVGTYKYTVKASELPKLSKAYINVEYKGSTSTTYAGAFAGSGKGLLIEFEAGE